tara:strand:+ start:126 stop:395 length:270 start_codon:yes stop_codon:yes gene_type:complete
MSEENTEEQKKPALAEVLIQTAVGIGKEQNMKLVEVIGHLEIAKMECFARNIRAAQIAAENQSDEPSEDADTQDPVAFSPDATEDTGEK